MCKLVKKMILWYLIKASQTDLCTPSCTIPLKFLNFSEKENCQ